MLTLEGNEIRLYGDVGVPWDEDGFTAAGVIRALATLGREEDVVIRINSAGGYTDDGIAIYNALCAHKGAVTVYVDAIAASSASIIAMAGDEIHMLPGALMMIHEPSASTWGTAAEHAASESHLDKLGSLMAGIYAEKSGGDAAEIRDLMRAETWMTGADAVERGFATKSGGSGEARAVAAFDYRAFAHAPESLVQQAQAMGWTNGRAARPENEETPEMGKDNAAPGAPAAEMRGRVKAIMATEAGRANLALAEYLAFETDLDAEAAAAIQTLAAEAKAAGGEAPEEGRDPALDAAPDAAAVASYQAGRSAAARLAQYEPKDPGKAKASLDPAAIFNARKSR